MKAKKKYEVEVLDYGNVSPTQDRVSFWFEGAMYVYYFEKGKKLKPMLKSFIKSILKCKHPQSSTSAQKE